MAIEGQRRIRILSTLRRNCSPFLLLLLVSLGCGGPPKPELDPSLDSLRLSGPEVLRLLPANTLFFVLSPDFSAFVSTLGRAEVAASAPDFDALIRDELRKELGFDLFDPEEIRSLGVSPEQPVGFAQIKERVGALFSAAVDPKQARASFEQSAQSRGATVREEQLEDALVLYAQVASSGDRGWLILRDGMGVLLLSHDGDDETWELARLIAQLTPERSISALQEYIDADAGLLAIKDPGEPLLVGGLNVTQMVSQELAEMEERIRKGDPWMVRQLEEARARGSRQDIEYWEQQIRESRKLDEREKARMEAEKSLLKQVFLPLELIAFEVAAEESALRLRAFSPASSECLLKQALGQLKREPPFHRIPGTSPVLAATCECDPQRSFALLELLMNASDPDSIRELDKAFGMLGIDMRKALVPLFTGQGELIVNVEALTTEASERFRLQGAVALSDVRAFTELWERALRFPLLMPLTSFDAVQQVWTLDVPYWRQVHARIREQRFEVSTKRSVFEVEPGTAFSQNFPQLHGYLENPKFSALLYGNFAWLLLFFAMDSSQWYFWDPYPEVPHSADAEAKLEELRRFVDSARAPLKEKLAQRDALVQELIDLIGVWGIAAHAVPEGLVFDGALFFQAASIAGGLARGYDLVVELEKLQDELWDASSKLNDAVQPLLQQYERAREVDRETQEPREVKTPVLGP
jgi:hypothetical protein